MKSCSWKNLDLPDQVEFRKSRYSFRVNIWKKEPGLFRKGVGMSGGGMEWKGGGSVADSTHGIGTGVGVCKGELFWEGSP